MGEFPFHEKLAARHEAASKRQAPEEGRREWVEAGERSEWLKEARQSLEHALTDLNSYGGARYFAEDYGAGLLDYVDTLRAYIQEKNEIIRAFAGPTGMTPEDVAYLREQRDEARREMVRLAHEVEYEFTKVGRLEKVLGDIARWSVRATEHPERAQGVLEAITANAKEALKRD